MNIVIGILIIIAGCVLIIKTEWFIQNFGTSAWAEQHLGSSGGTRLMYKLIGLAVIILSVMGMTGMLGEVIISMFGRLFGLK
jgi:CDP-diglyceride synthetase